MPGAKGYFVCANDHIDLRTQNGARLAGEIKLLALKDRRLNKLEDDELVVIFFDESHFGDGNDMTMKKYLDRVRASCNHPKRLLVSVSATPFSSIEYAEDRYFPDMEKLEAAGYNSMGRMLREGWIKRPDQLIFDDGSGALQINMSANVYRHIARIMKDDEPLFGYGMIRATSDCAELLEAHLNAEYGPRLQILHWNMRNPEFDLAEVLKAARHDVFVLILVQQKARMGTTIPTKGFEFFYEYSPSSCLDTAAQSFLGRACGFNKREKVVIYADPIKARAYDMFAKSHYKQKEMAKMASFCGQHDIEVSLRAQFSNRAIYEIHYDEVCVHSNSTLAALRLKIRTRCGELGLDTDPIIRTLSKTDIDKYKGNPKSLNPNHNGLPYDPGKNPGDVNVFIFDRPVIGKKIFKKDWSGLIGRIYFRSETVRATRSTLVARASLFSKLPLNKQT